MRNILLLIFIFMISACTSKATQVPYCEVEDREIGCEIPLISILVNPNIYSKKHITTKAYLFNENSLFYMSLYSSDKEAMRLYPLVNVQIKDLEKVNVYDGELYLISGFFDHASMTIDADYVSILPPLGGEIEIIEMKGQ